MKAAPFTLRVEALEGRLLMAADVPAVWPTETPLMAMDNSAQIETLTSSQSLARVVSLSVEHSASDLVLNIQLSS